MVIKLVASDIDGTIINDLGYVSDRTKNAVLALKDKGIDFVLITGRSYEGGLNVAKQLDIDQKGYGLISLNGLQTYRFPSETPEIKMALSYEECTAINEVGQRYYMGVLYCFADKLYFEIDDITYQDYKISMDENRLRFFNDRLRPEFIKDISEIKHRFESGTPIEKIVFMQSDSFMSLVADRIKRDLPNPFEGLLVGKGWMEIMPPHVSKGNALIDYAESLGITRDEIMVFGDAENDISMFRITPYSVAMDNAMETLLAVAQYRTLNNNEDGVADYIEKHLLDM